MPKKKVVVVGAGPGGLTAAMILAHRGYEVHVYEKQAKVGGRNASLEFDDFVFDVGPTFLMMAELLNDVFTRAGRLVADYLDVKRIDPLYRLVFGNGVVFHPTHDREKMKEQLDRLFPGEWEGYQRFLSDEKVKYDRVTPCLQVPYDTFGSYFSKKVLRALPYLHATRSLYGHLGHYFKSDLLKLAFTFQAKYLGMSPWKCPGTFSIISYIEHADGIFHPIGGLNQISKAMAKIVEEDGGKLYLSSPVQEVLVENGHAKGILLESGERVEADYVVINADFAHAMKHLVKPEHRTKRWTDARIDRSDFSCSTYMLYLGLDKLYDQPHHSIIFSPDYKKNVMEIADEHVLSEDPSVYVQNASITDKTLAPEGKSALYILVPITNNRSRIAWKEIAPSYREKVLDIVEQRGGFPDLRQHIVAERTITPTDWETKSAVHLGATFNLAHSLNQMLYLRPHNQFEEFEGCYLVGGGTHPGSGLPTIYESGRISADIISARDGVPT
jgi:phytoene desaturase